MYDGGYMLGGIQKPRFGAKSRDGVEMAQCNLSSKEVL